MHLIKFDCNCVGFRTNINDKALIIKACDSDNSICYRAANVDSVQGYCCRIQDMNNKKFQVLSKDQVAIFVMNIMRLVHDGQQLQALRSNFRKMLDL